MHTEVKFFNFFDKGSIPDMDKTGTVFSKVDEAVDKRAAPDFLKILQALAEFDPQGVQVSPDPFGKSIPEGGPGTGAARLRSLVEDADSENELLEFLMARAFGSGVSPEELGHDGAEGKDAGQDCCCGEVTKIGDPTVTMESDLAKGPAADTGTTSVESDAFIEPRIDLPEALAAGLSTSSVGPEAADSELATTKAPPGVAAETPVVSDSTASDLFAAPGPTAMGASSAKPTETIQEPAVTGSDKPVPPAPSIHGPTEPEPVTTATALQSAEASVTPGAEKKPQATETGSPVPDPAGETKATGLERALQAIGAPEPDSKPDSTGTGRQNAMQQVARNLEDRSAAASGSADPSGSAFPDETETGPPIHAPAEGDDVVQRAPNGRDGLHSLMSRTGTGGSHETQAAAGNQDTPAPTREMQTDVIRQIVQRMTLRTQGGESRMQIHLKPEFLGSVHMQVSTDQHQVMVRMTADSQAVKETIEQHLHVLRSELQQHGLQIDKFDVLVSGDGEGWKNSQDPSGFRQALHQRRHGQNDGRRGVRAGRIENGSRAPARQLRRDNGEIDYFA